MPIDPFTCARRTNSTQARGASTWSRPLNSILRRAARSDSILTRSNGSSAVRVEGRGFEPTSLQGAFYSVVDILYDDLLETDARETSRESISLSLSSFIDELSTTIFPTPFSFFCYSVDGVFVLCRGSNATRSSAGSRPCRQVESTRACASTNKTCLRNRKTADNERRNWRALSSE